MLVNGVIFSVASYKISEYIFALISENLYIHYIAKVTESNGTGVNIFF